MKGEKWLCLRNQSPGIKTSNRNKVQVAAMVTDEHATAGEQSRSLCDALFEELERQLPNLERRKTTRQCLLRLGNGTFAWIRHRKRQAKIEVFSLAEPEMVDQYPLLDRRRRPSSFAPQMRSRFFVTGKALGQACEVLVMASQLTAQR